MLLNAAAALRQGLPQLAAACAGAWNHVSDAFALDWPLGCEEFHAKSSKQHVQCVQQQKKLWEKQPFPPPPYTRPPPRTITNNSIVSMRPFNAHRERREGF
jgi:hypothetical protein